MIMIGWNHGCNVALVVTIAWSPSLPFLHSFYRESGQWCCPSFLHLMFLWFAAICTPLVCPVWGRWSKRMQVSRKISVCLFVNIKSKPSSDTLVEPIERYHLHQMYNPRQQIGKRLLNPLQFLAGVATPSFTKQCENMKSAAKAFRLASGSYSIETYGICSKFSIKSLETQKRAGMGTYLRS